jgi:hypothetical protein
MLNNTHYYHRITRKMVVLFGTMFNNLRLKRYNKEGTTEIERITVPLTYSSKEKFYARITQDPDLARQIQVVLPRMAFELTAITYDPLRKNSSFVEQFTSKNSDEISRITRTPYNFEFSLYIFVRNVEDGTQLVEQILPYFAPDYTLTATLVDGIKTDLPIILQSVSEDTTNDTGGPDQLRSIVWTLTFTMKGYLYGPTSTSKIIRQVTANTFYYNTEGTTRKLNLGNPGSNTSFKIGELVYEGRTISDANSSGFVVSWDDTAKVLIISDASGIIQIGKQIRGAVTNASYNITSFETADYQLSKLVITPDPLSANANDAFGFTEVITIAPDL